MSRRLLAAGRILLWGAVALVWVRGALTFFPGATGAARPAEAQAVKASFPEDPGRAVAVSFAQEYLTFGKDGTTERSKRLTAFLPEGADPSVGWDGRGVAESTSAVPVGLSVLGPRTAVATVAARSGPRWLYLAVPLAVDAGRIVVSDLPAFVAGPWPSAGVDAAPISGDPSHSADIRPALESFFRAYAGGSQGDPSYFAAPGRTLEGLGGSMDFAGLVELRAGEGDRTLPAVARVRWVDRTTGAGLTQTYRLMLVARDGRWYVDRLGAGPALSKEA
jgi:hypothetical protein